MKPDMVLKIAPVLTAMKHIMGGIAWAAGLH